MKTKLTEMFGIEYPIVQSGMQWLAVPQLAAAVCNAGGIGTINVTCWPTLDEFADALDEMNSLTNKPYVVKERETFVVFIKTCSNIPLASHLTIIEHDFNVI